MGGFWQKSRIFSLVIPLKNCHSFWCCNLIGFLQFGNWDDLSEEFVFQTGNKSVLFLVSDSQI
jgi:hypothetical protein